MFDYEATKKLFKEIEEEINSPEAIVKSLEIEKQCEKIRSMALNTKEDILKAKEASRSIPMSSEKVLLFKELICRENNIK